MIDVVVCVHDATDHARRCLESLGRHSGGRHRLIVVDDGSGPDCQAMLACEMRKFAVGILIRNDEARGYTKAANQGLRASAAELAVLLNSDTIVTPHWLERIAECAASDERIGIVGPLSNAAAYQSVPEVFGPEEEWALNALPPGWDVDAMAALVAAMAPRAFPRVAFINGFCLAIKRSVIEAIGYFDEASFPEAFGEETDYCLRAAKAGFTCAVADHAYVYHAKAKSYADLERRRTLKRAGSAALARTYGSRTIRSGVGRNHDEPTLARLREMLRSHLQETSPPC